MLLVSVFGVQVGSAHICLGLGLGLVAFRWAPPVSDGLGLGLGLVLGQGLGAFRWAPTTSAAQYRDTQGSF